MTPNNKNIIERVESKKMDRAKIILGWIAIAGIVYVAQKLLMADRDKLNNPSFWTDLLLMPGILWLLYFTGRAQMQKRSGQFIEWTADEITYKLKNETMPQIIKIDKIKHVEVHVETIEVIADTKHVLDITDFGVYEDRVKIKNYLESIIPH